MYSRVALIELWMSLGLASQGLFHSAGLCHYPSSHRCVSLFQLHSYSQAHRPVLITSLHAVLCIMCFKVSIPTQCVWADNFFACSGCFYSPSSVGPAQLHLHSSMSECLSWDLDLNSTILHISSHPPNPYVSTATPPFGLQTAHCSKGQIKLHSSKLPILVVEYNHSMLSPLWADTFSFIITFIKTMLMFVLSMKCLQN